MPLHDINGFAELERIQKELEQLVPKATVVAERFFLRNFDLQGFQGDNGLEKWDVRSPDFRPGRMLEVDTGKERDGLRGTHSGSTITVQVTGPAAKYIDTQNFGDKITVTEKMKKFFWAKYYETKNVMWKGMALKRVGEVIVIKPRKIIGDSAALNRELQELFEHTVRTV